MTAEIGLRDVVDGWHAAVALGLASPHAALLTETTAVGLAAIACAHGHHKPTPTLLATTTVGVLAAHYLH